MTIEERLAEEVLAKHGFKEGDTIPYSAAKDAITEFINVVFNAAKVV